MELLNALIAAYDYTESEAREEIKEMRRRIFRDCESPLDILDEYGLEHDYVFDLF